MDRSSEERDKGKLRRDFANARPRERVERKWRGRRSEAESRFLSFYPPDLDSFGRTASQPSGQALMPGSLYASWPPARFRTEETPPGIDRTKVARFLSAGLESLRSKEILETIVRRLFLRDRLLCSQGELNGEKVRPTLLSDFLSIMQRNRVRVLPDFPSPPSSSFRFSMTAATIKRQVSPSVKHVRVRARVNLETRRYGRAWRITFWKIPLYESCTLRFWRRNVAANFNLSLIAKYA